MIKAIKKYPVFIVMLILAMLAIIPKLLTVYQSYQENVGCDGVTAYPDTEMNRQFERTGNGWTGGDGTYSIGLPDGRVVWLFGDSFLGTVNQDGSRPMGTRLICNTMVVQNDDDWMTFYNGTYENPTAFLRPQNSAQWYWPGDGTVIGDSLLIFWGVYSQVKEGAWGFKYTGQDDIAIMTLPELTIKEVITLYTDSRIRWGMAILEQSDYIYIYGVEEQVQSKHLHVARTLPDDLLASWEYFDGSGWVSDPKLSKSIYHSISTEFSVVAWNEGYWLITQEDHFSQRIVMLRADSPMGSWHTRELLYCTPETRENIFTYNAQLHPEFTTDEGWLISYDVNSFEFQNVFNDVTSYRPRFVRVPMNRK